MRGRRLRLESDGRRRQDNGRAGGRRQWSRLGLRARLTVTFGLGALALSASMAGLTYFTARQFSLSQHQDADVRQTFANASKVLGDLRSNTTQYLTLLDSLDSS